MNTGLIPVRYASALYQYASESKQQEQVYGEIKTLASNFAHYTRLRSALENPVLSMDDKRKIVLTATGNKTSEVFLKFLELVLNNKREKYLYEITLKYIDLYRKKNKIFHCKLTTATEVEDRTERSLMKLVETTTGGKVELDKHIDANIIGGFLFEFDFNRWDASVSGQLNRIRNEYKYSNKKTL